ncbi:heterokaryon incompatibility protein-domain-containing protein [Apiosordaria backusii]|uniref:Heterokaryon incompatibility protein-domain-containing protein n=1 Tax=Apiosordaria backusii TaxID=314023 RepID=A0AA40B2K6_9PEZI|nr:heterokaryon incompatibility protein-domain-containing protein [Apiosordaria backusii]
MSDPAETILLSTCRSCKDPLIPYITLSPPGEDASSAASPEPIKILVGIPTAGCCYKAISHVWGDVKPVRLECQSCDKTTSIQLKGKRTFDAIMSLAKPGSTIWMDNISIDQDDPSDVATQVAAMGTIYEGAKVVAVMLPPEDAEAYDCLSTITEVCSVILAHRHHFDFENDPQSGHSEEEPYPMLSKTVQKFFALFTSLREITATAKYWSRAWTFQEWALAKDVDVGLESDDSSHRKTLCNAKSAVIDVATLVVSYKLRMGQYAAVNVGFSRSPAASRLEEVKRLFPSEVKFLSEAERNEEEVNLQLNFSTFANDQLLGIRLNPLADRTAEELFLARLTTMLNAFTGGSTRQATFEADMVCCWASMCNIEYGYAKHDTLNVAIRKVTRALRKRGLKLYNFHSLSTASPDADPRFFSYSYVHAKSNVDDRDTILGIPFLTGRMDTSTHFLASLATHPDEWSLPQDTRDGGFRVHKVKGCHFAFASLSDTKDVLTMFAITTSGRPDGIHGDTVRVISSDLEQLPDRVRAFHVMVLAVVPLAPGSDRGFAAWTVIAAPVVLSLVRDDQWSIGVGREDLNGTLVFFARKNAGSSDEKTVVLGYLAISDNICGSFLIPSSPEGNIRVVLDSPGRTGAVNSDSIGKRMLEARIELYTDAEKMVEEDESDAQLIMLRPGNNQAVLKEVESRQDRLFRLMSLMVSRLDSGTGGI